MDYKRTMGKETLYLRRKFDDRQALWKSDPDHKPPLSRVLDRARLRCRGARRGAGGNEVHRLGAPKWQAVKM